MAEQETMGANETLVTVAQALALMGKEVLDESGFVTDRIVVIVGIVEVRSKELRPGCVCVSTGSSVDDHMEAVQRLLDRSKDPGRLKRGPLDLSLTIARAYDDPERREKPRET